MAFFVLLLGFCFYNKKIYKNTQFKAKDLLLCELLAV